MFKTMLCVVVLAVCSFGAVTAQPASGCGTIAIAKAGVATLTKLASSPDCFGNGDTVAAPGKAVHQDWQTTLPVLASIKKIGITVSDSLSIFGGSNHTNVNSEAHPDAHVRSAVVGSTVLDVVTDARLSGGLPLKPREVAVFFEANDLTGYSTANAWLRAGRTLVAKFGAMGATLRFGSAPQQCVAAEDDRRATRMQFEAKGVAHAAAPILAKMCDKTVLVDRVHPLDGTPGRINDQGLFAKTHEAWVYPDAVFYPPLPGPLVISPPPTVYVPTETTAPTLAGVSDVASGLNAASLLQPAWGNGAIPGPEAPDQGAFRFLCAPSHEAYDDPIIYPGQPGKSHLHTFFGNTKADAFSTFASLRTTGDSTCNNALNRSAYWIAAMMHSTGKVVLPDYVAIYYKRAPAGNAACSSFGVKACLPLPRGLRVVFGYNMQNPAKPDPAWARYWNCDGPGAVSGHFATIREAAAGCPVGARLGAIVISPPCWNGKALDSKDHRSHMAYPQDDHNGHSVCPASHPYILPFFQLGAWYTNDGTASQWRLSSDDMPGMRMDGGSNPSCRLVRRVGGERTSIVDEELHRQGAVMQRR